MNTLAISKSCSNHPSSDCLLSVLTEKSFNYGNNKLKTKEYDIKNNNHKISTNQNVVS